MEIFWGEREGIFLTMLGIMISLPLESHLIDLESLFWLTQAFPSLLIFGINTILTDV